MPHKHRRFKASYGEDSSQFDLPPTVFAKPLPTVKQDLKSDPRPAVTTTITITDHKKARLKAKRKARKFGDSDDTPKAFSRLLQFQKAGRYPSGLDDGASKPSSNKKRKRNDATDSTAAQSHKLSNNNRSDCPPKPTILPGERLSSFSARVDAALPVSGLITRHSSRSRSDPVPGLRVRRTKLERRMQKMYDEWRVADIRIKEKRAAALEEEVVDGDDDDGYGNALREGDLSIAGTKKQKRKSKRARRNGDDHEDPWAHLLTARNEPPRRPLHDVVQAPPHLTHLPKEKLVSRSLLDDVPKTAGSLRRREELGGLRRGVVQSYRATMGERREGNPRQETLPSN